MPTLTTMTTHLHHDKCIAARETLRQRDPALFAKATARGAGNGTTKGTPEHELMLDLDALDAMAASFATGDRVRVKQQRRAARIVAALEA